MVDTVRLDELFDIGKGVAPSKFDSVKSESFEGSVALLRPAYRQGNTLIGYVDPGGYEVYPEETLFVSTNGEGSHSYAYVAEQPFLCNNDVSPLVARSPMTLNEKLFYAMAITANRPRFGYARKPKGERLASLQLPATPPDWVHDYSVDAILGEFDKAMVERENDAGSADQKIDTSDWVEFRIGDLFDIKRGNVKGIKGLTFGDVPVVSARETDNGVAQLASVTPQFDAGTISVSVNGAVGYATVQQKPWSGTGDVMALLLYGEHEPTVLAKLAVCTLIREEGQRFGYARKLNQERLENMTVRLPAVLDESGDVTPDWDRLDEKMQELAFSRYVATDSP